MGDGAFQPFMIIPAQQPKRKAAMKTLPIVGVISFLFLAATLSAADESLNIYPKNLARQHLGTGLLSYNPTNQAYVPLEAAAAWTDDDVATGKPATKGQHYYLLTLVEPQLLSNFAISETGAVGTVSLYAGDEPSPPTAKSWKLLAKDMSVDAINQTKLDKPFSRFAKYLLIETNLTTPGTWYSLYLYGERPAVSYHLKKRTAPIDPVSILGKSVNSEGGFNLAGLYTNARVTYANGGVGFIGWQKLIDDNPASNVAIQPSEGESGMVVRYGDSHQIHRISVLGDPGVAGKLEFFLVKDLATKGEQTQVPGGNESQYIPAAFHEKPMTAMQAQSAVSLLNLKPAATIELDGVKGRGSADFGATDASTLLVRWIPKTPGQNFAMREINCFGEVTLSDYELTPEGVAEQTFSDGKEYKGGKEALPPVGELLPPKTPFVPGEPAFPPNVTVFPPAVTTLPPTEPTSP